MSSTDAESACRNDAFDRISRCVVSDFSESVEEAIPDLLRCRVQFAEFIYEKDNFLFLMVCAKSIEKGLSSFYGRERTLMVETSLDCGADRFPKLIYSIVVYCLKRKAGRRYVNA